MAANTRTQAEVEQVRDEIRRRLLRGEKQVVIAHALGMSRAMVSYEKKMIVSEWQKCYEDFNQNKRRELAKLDEDERTAWAMFEESKTITKSRHSSKQQAPTGTDPHLVPAEITLITQEGPGDPRHLNTVLKCIDKRIKLLGLDAPFREEPAKAADKPVEKPFLTPRQRAQRISEMLGIEIPMDGSEPAAVGSTD